MINIYLYQVMQIVILILFMVNGKYIIIRNIRLSKQKNRRVIFMDILARESLSRNDLNQLKQKIQTNFPGNMVIRARIEYIL
jgi:hypothetical protein